MVMTALEHENTSPDAKFSEQWIVRFGQYSVSRTYPRGTLIFSQGDKSDGIFIIREGRIKVFMSDESGKEILIAILGPGEIVGEIASLDGQPRTASVTAIVDTRVARISLPEFRVFLEDNPDLAFEIIRILTSRMRDHATSISNLAFKNVYERVVWLLEKHAEQNDDGTLTIRQKFTQQDIGDMVGSSREMVSRVISELIKGGYVSREQKIFTILKPLPRGW
jgi:CRP/FNR family cyclic AMP-dependent transcriptional regulator